MAAARQKTNVEVVNEFIANFVAKTQHLLDRKLEPPLAKPKGQKWDEHFTLNKSDEDLIAAHYANHAAAALHFIMGFANQTFFSRDKKLLLNRFLFLQAFHLKGEVSHSYTPRIVDKDTRFLAEECLILINNLAGLADPYQGFVGSNKRKALDIFSKMISGRNLLEEFKHYHELLKSSLEYDIKVWDNLHPKTPAFVSSGARIMAVIIEKRQLPAAPVEQAQLPVEHLQPKAEEQLRLPNPPPPKVTSDPVSSLHKLKH